VRELNAGHDVRLEPLSGPDVWTGTQLGARDDWIHVPGADEVDELAAAVAAVRAAGTTLYKVTAAGFPLPRLGHRLAAIAGSLERGCGVAALRGIPAGRFSLEDLRIALWGIGAHLGTAVSQNSSGEFLAEVRDYGEQLGLAHSRGYRSNAALRFHTDRCDVAALLCARQCREGGENRIVSTPAIHNAMLERCPELLQELYGTYCHSRQGEEVAGQRRYYESPVFAVHRGRFTSQYSRAYVESAQKFPEVPRLRPRQDEALDVLARLADELAAQVRMRDGDIVLLNNHVTYHSRTAIVDWDDPQRKRLLFRLWLSVPGSRELPPSFAELWGATAAGALRGGVTPPSGLRDVEAWRRARA
jgi:hypothetical protein